MSLLKKLSTLKDQLLAATGEIHAVVTQVRSQLAETQRKLEVASTAPVPPDELVQRIYAHFTERDEFRFRDLARTLLQTLGRPVAVAPPTEFEVEFVRALLLRTALDAVPTLVGRLEYEPGSPSAERPALIAKLQAEVEELGRQEEMLIDEANANGVTIQHRTEVRERRITEKLQAERRAAAEADRREREAQRVEHKFAGQRR